MIGLFKIFGELYFIDNLEKAKIINNKLFLYLVTEEGKKIYLGVLGNYLINEFKQKVEKSIKRQNKAGMSLIIVDIDKIREEILTKEIENLME